MTVQAADSFLFEAAIRGAQGESRVMLGGGMNAPAQAASSATGGRRAAPLLVVEVSGANA